MLCSLGGAVVWFSPFGDVEGQGTSARSSSAPRELVTPRSEAEHAALAREAESLSVRFAPTFLQETSNEHPERDRPLPLDFDGDFQATNNWQNLGAEALALGPTVYGSAILTRRYAYLTYTLFYPRDWASPWCVSYVCHDNDLETVLVVASRRDPSLVFVETKSHRRYLSLRGAEVRTDAAGRPVISVESEGHGMRVLAKDDSEVAPRQRVFFHEASDPPSAHAAREAYVLASLYDSLWTRRPLTASEGRLWTEGESGPLRYAGERAGRLGHALGASMAGQKYAGGVRPPWALKAEHGQRGDWFLDPAFVARARHADLAGEDVNPSYELNQYLSDLSGECSGASCSESPVVRAGLFAGSRLWGSLCLALGIVLGLPYARLCALLRARRTR